MGHFSFLSVRITISDEMVLLIFHPVIFFLVESEFVAWNFIFAIALIYRFNLLFFLVQVMSVKALGTSLKLTFEGKNQLIYPETWFFMFVVATCVITQMNYLNKASNQFTIVLYYDRLACERLWHVGQIDRITLDNIKEWNDAKLLSIILSSTADKHASKVSRKL